MVDEYLSQLTAVIDKHGWAVQYVGSTENDPIIPFAYTVGLAKKDLPELLIYALSYDVSGAILNTMAAMMAEEQLPTEEPIQGVLKNDVPIMLIDVSDADHQANMSINLYGDIKVHQVVFPDASGNFPWDEGYENDGIPFLGKPPKEK